MKLSTNARILTTDGKDIGHLSRFVMDPLTKKVTHIVLKHGLLEKQEYIIMMDLVDYADEQGVHLKPLPVYRVEDLPRFSLDQYIITNEHALMDRGFISDEIVQGEYYYPTTPSSAEGILRVDNMYIDNPPNQGPSLVPMNVPGENQSPVLKEEEENIPDGTVAIKEGAKVISSDAKTLGKVEKVVADPNSEKATYLLVTKGWLTKEKKLIPTSLIKNAGDEEVYLNIPEQSFKDLPDYEGG